MLPADTLGLSQVGMDGQVIAATAGLAILTGFVFGLAPALSVSETDLAHATKTGAQRASGSIWTAVRNALIGLEVALTFLLVVSAALLLRSLGKLSDTQPGFESNGVLAVRVSPDQTACSHRDACISFYKRLLDGARGLPGVVNVAAVNSVPLDGQLPTQPVDVEGHPKTAEHPAPMLLAYAVTPPYISMMRVPLLAGRTLSETDGARSNGVLLISAETARRFWPNESAIGKHIKLPAAKNGARLSEWWATSSITVSAGVCRTGCLERCTCRIRKRGVKMAKFQR